MIFLEELLKIIEEEKRCEGYSVLAVGFMELAYKCHKDFKCGVDTQSSVYIKELGERMLELAVLDRDKEKERNERKERE